MGEEHFGPALGNKVALDTKRDRKTLEWHPHPAMRDKCITLEFFVLFFAIFVVYEFFR